MRFFRAALILALCSLLADTLTATQGGQTSETKTNALTNKDVLEMLRAGLGQEVVIAKLKSSACNLDTSPTALKELKAAHVPKKVILAMVQVPANTESRRIQNIAPEEMWTRVTQCVFPAYSGLAFDAHITGTVEIGLGISPEGNVANYRVLDGPPLLVQSAVDAIREWKFRPNVVHGETTWSRVRALMRFNPDGTTAVDLAPAILADNFGDPGTPRSSASAFLKPVSSPECKSAADLPKQTGDRSVLVSTGEGDVGPFRVGKGGVGHPSCIYCPDPQYSAEARNAKIQGKVVLSVVIGVDGHAANIKVVKSLGYRLDEKAVEAVETWCFKPAVGPNGNPVATITSIEVRFRFLKN